MTEVPVRTDGIVEWVSLAEFRALLAKPAEDSQAAEKLALAAMQQAGESHESD